MHCVFIRYILNRSAYRFLVDKSEIPDIHINMIIESRDVVFFEDIFCINGKKTRLLGKEHMTQHLGMKPSEPTLQMEDESRRSQRSRTSKSFGPDFVANTLESELQTFKEAVYSRNTNVKRSCIQRNIIHPK